MTGWCIYKPYHAIYPYHIISYYIHLYTMFIEHGTYGTYADTLSLNFCPAADEILGFQRKDQIIRRQFRSSLLGECLCELAKCPWCLTIYSGSHSTIFINVRWFSINFHQFSTCSMVFFVVFSSVSSASWLLQISRMLQAPHLAQLTEVPSEVRSEPSEQRDHRWLSHWSLIEMIEILSINHPYCMVHTSVFQVYF